MTFASGIFLPSATHCLVSSNFTDLFFKSIFDGFAGLLDTQMLGLDYIDLYLIHQPMNDYYGSWRAMEGRTV